MKKWNILNKLNHRKLDNLNEELINLLLKNRGITDKKSTKEFLNPKLENVTVESVGIDKKQLKKTLARIFEAIEKKEKIIVYGDYDVDGITGTAILWETLNSLGSDVMPFLPDRIEDGYGLSITGISNIKKQISKIKETKLIITVDNGIVANEAVAFARENGIDVIITDHHTMDAKLPNAFAIVHTTKLCGAGIAYLLSQEIKYQSIRQAQDKRSKIKTDEDNHLELAALGTIADMVPLTGANRAIVKFGLEKLAKTRRPGLLELFKQTGILKDSGQARNVNSQTLGVYEVGFMIAPRLNAAGRIENAMDSLRLLCTKDKNKARVLAEKLELTNRERQLIMRQAAEHAISNLKSQISKPNSKLKSILISAHESYQQGIIGLVAGKLVDEFYRPSIVISLGEIQSKGSARSVVGFNIIEFLRNHSSHFVNVGGHPMAAGFTIETEKIVEFKKSIETNVEKLLDGEMLTKKLKIDCELPFSVINKEFYTEIQQLAPFGMGNPEPVFATKNVIVEDLRVLGREGKHLKLNLKSQISNLKTTSQNSKLEFEAIAFGMGEMGREIKVGDNIDVAYTVDENTWNGNTKLQLKVKDLRKTN